ncbi:ATP-binding protein [Corynebacterium sp. 319]|uniref:ATP-binding protein n=1 Tax=unclassified Corynebacterium TaxID=2624378 RepID=UPI00125CB5F0|nr:MULTISPECIES: DUF4143 domain-containing protein [unclassified Corynebacterium]KAB1554266.1 ATP-binding protein [Corynebacterium sp. 319]KAB3539990.1 ATP-binding protein [Corynebacterium sp. 366]
MNRSYRRRAIDSLLDNYLPHLPAIAIEGPKGVGKTETARQRSTAELRLDTPGMAQLLEANPGHITDAEGTLLIDEWQRYTPSWDLVRRAVDDGARPGSYLLTGSAFPPVGSAIHSGAARIDAVRMRPFTLQERLDSSPALRIESFFNPSADEATASHPTNTIEELDLTPEWYATEICRSGLPGIMDLPENLRVTRLDSYVERLATHEFPEQGLRVRNPQAVLRWLTAYAAATSQTTSYTEILDYATPGDATKPSRSTADAYRNLLEQLMILEPLPAWTPLIAGFPKTAKAPKHHLCDPALAARLLGARPHSLISGDPQQIQLFSQLFESLAVLTARVAAETFGARVSHLRTHKGDHEVDIIVEGPDKRVLGIEVKISPVIKDEHAKHLHWLHKTLGDRFTGGIIVHAGQHFYQRRDGIWVVPLAALA